MSTSGGMPGPGFRTRMTHAPLQGLRPVTARAVFLFLWWCFLFCPFPCLSADWVRIDVLTEEERELPNIFLDFDAFREAGDVAVVSARLVNPDSSYVELVVKMNCAKDQFDVPLSRFYSREGVLVSSEPVATPEWVAVPRGSHVDFIKFFLCAGAGVKSAKEFGMMRGFRDFAISARAAGKGGVP